MASYLLLIFAAFAAGVINSVAGGGSFFTFPALVFTGVPSIIANASSTLALLPGSLASAWAYRDDLRKTQGLAAATHAGRQPRWRNHGRVVAALYTPQRTFDSVIPWLMLASTLLFAFGPRISPMLKRAFHIGAVTVVVIQFLVAIYGGYFGGAIGIIMLATWSVFGLTDIHEMNANKTVLGSAANAVAVVLFIVARKIWWPQTLAMLVAAVIGGYIGALSAKKVNQKYLRATIIVTSVAITIAFFLRQY